MEIVPTNLGCTCGGPVRMHMGVKQGPYAFARCDTCGKQTTWWGNRHRAEEAWTAGKFALDARRAEA
jgi:hypothetical protein